MDSTDHEQLKSRILEFIGLNLKETRFKHTINVAETAVKMAVEAGENPAKAEMAALLHDCARNLPGPVMNMYIKNLELPERYIGNINLAHSKIGVAFAQKEFGIYDKDILNAISYHTTGRRGMSVLEKIIFLADAIEPGRDYPGVDIIRSEAAKSLDKGCLESLKNTVEFLKSEDIYIDEDTIDALNDIKEIIE